MRQDSVAITLVWQSLQFAGIEENGWERMVTELVLNDSWALESQPQLLQIPLQPSGPNFERVIIWSVPESSQSIEAQGIYDMLQSKLPQV